MSKEPITVTKAYTEKFKRNIVSMFLRGRNGKYIRDKYNIPKSTFYYWIEEYKKIYRSDGLLITKHDYKTILSENEKMKKQLEIYKLTGCSPQSLENDRLLAIQKYKSKYPITYLCELLNINRSKFYRFDSHQETKLEKYDKKLIMHIKEISANNPCYGSKRICHELARQGFVTSYKKVSRLMKENDIHVHIGKKPSRPQLRGSIFNDNILIWKKKYALKAPDIAWLSDITEFYVCNCKFYICSIEDIFSRYVISINISTTNDTTLVANTFNDAYQKRKHPYGLIFHSDHGTNFTATSLRAMLKTYGVQQSFSRVATPQDNGYMESFFATLKKEELYLKTYNSPEEFFQSVNNYIDYYNNFRLHSRLNYRTPKEVLDEFDEIHNWVPF